MELINENFKFIKGDTYTRNFSVTKSEIFSITQIYYTVKTQQNGKPLLQKTIGNGITLITEDENKLYYAITFEASDTDKLKTSIEYLHDIEVVSGRIKQTLLKGKLILDEEVTTYKNE